VFAAKATYLSLLLLRILGLYQSSTIYQYSTCQASGQYSSGTLLFFMGGSNAQTLLRLGARSARRGRGERGQASFSCKHVRVLLRSRSDGEEKIPFKGGLGRERTEEKREKRKNKSREGDYTYYYLSCCLLPVLLPVTCVEFLEVNSASGGGIAHKEAGYKR